MKSIATDLSASAVCQLQQHHHSYCTNPQHLYSCTTGVLASRVSLTFTVLALEAHAHGVWRVPYSAGDDKTPPKMNWGGSLAERYEDRELEHARWLCAASIELWHSIAAFP
jgi:hypothetical protein